MALREGKSKTKLALGSTLTVWKRRKERICEGSESRPWSTRLKTVLGLKQPDPEHDYEPSQHAPQKV